MRVDVEIEFIDLDNDQGRMIPGIIATCTRCDHEVECFGQSPRSVRRCFILLKEECPEGEENYYTCDDEFLDD